MVSPHESTGYEHVAAEFIAGRGSANSAIETSAVVDWAQTLPLDATVLDLGCGTGAPISQVLIERGLKVYGVDAFPTSCE
jgi:2-polyprenyl-3-methyl-5-hydroxy-6-metoxy-1,4-benzoquinol methylase